MKRFVLFLLIMPVLLFSEVTLSSGGRIVVSESSTASSFTDSYPCAGGLLQLTHNDDVLPVNLRLIRPDGSKAGEWSFSSTIGTVFSPNTRWFAFSDGERLYGLDTVSGLVTHCENAPIFNISDDGEFAVWTQAIGGVNYLHRIHPLTGIVRSLLWHQGELFIHTPNEIVRFSDGQVLYHSQSSLHDVRSHNGKLYVSERDANGYHLLLWDNSGINEILSVPLAPSRSSRTHSPIQGPLYYGETNYPFNIGNSYLEIQDYSSGAYLHPGVDFIGVPYDATYAVANGVVKAVLTTGGDNYWRVAVALEDTNEECEGYLYAHLAQNSITVSVGDEVQAGDLLGNIVQWPIAEFHHCHFARISESGSVWNGAWWTTDDPLRDVTNLADTTAPVFLNAHGDDLFAFRAANNTFLDPLDLSGQMDIIARGGDYTNSSWLISFNGIGYRIAPLDDPDSVLVDQLSFTMDYPCDDYINGAYMLVCIPIIYSRTQPCYSNANYIEREYYYIITKADADSTITGDEADCSFDTTLFPDDWYILTVWAEDGAGNRTEESMIIYINNNINQPPQFIDMPENITVTSGQTYIFDVWSHVEDDATPDSALVFDFITDNDSLHWAYNGDGTLALNHQIEGEISQTAHLTITAIDEEEASTSYTIDVVLEPNQGIADDTIELLALSCYPNPFNPQTTVSFHLAEPSEVRLLVYNTRGQRVRTLMNDACPTGEVHRTWNGTDDNGTAVASGVYLVRLQTANQTTTTRILMLK